MRVLFVTHFRENTAIFYRQLGFATELSKRGNSVVLLCRRPLSEEDKPGTFVYHKVERKWWDEPYERRLLRNLAKLQRLVSDSDVVHVSRASPYTAPLLLATHLRRDQRLVVDFEDWDGLYGYANLSHAPLAKSMLLEWLSHFFPKKADAIISISRYINRLLVEYGIPKEKICYIPAGFDPALFNGETYVKSDKAQDIPTVIVATRIWKWEAFQLETAYAAFRMVREKFPSAKMLIMGGGLRDLAGSLARRLGVADGVVQLGFVPREKVPKYMAAADVALHVVGRHIYYLASCPSIIPEYMAMEKPIVATEIGEIRDMLRDDHGILVGDTDPSSYARSLMWVFDNIDNASKMGKVARLKAIQNYSYPVLTQRLLGEYEQILPR